MMTLEKGLTPDQIADVEELGRIKQRFSPERWLLFRTLMLTYINGFEAGIATAQDAPGQDTKKKEAV